MSTTMKCLTIASAMATVPTLLGTCATNPSGAGDGQRLSRADREETTGSMMPRRRNGSAVQTIGKDQIDPNQILNPSAIQSRALGNVGG